MTAFKRLLIALDFSEADEDLIRYTEFLSKIYRPEDLYFIHCAPNLVQQLDFSLRFKDENPYSKPLDEELASTIRHRVQRYFSDPGPSNVHAEVIEGKAEQQIRHWAEVKSVDLVVLGRHTNGREDAVEVKRLMRQLPCNVLIVPESTEPSIQQITVPVDFSQESAAAILHAKQIAERLDDVTITVLHIFDIPPGHFQLSRSAAQFERIMGANARDAMERFLQKCDASALLPKAVLLPAEAANPSREIHHYLNNHPADLVIMGAKGHSAVERFLVGSVTEGLVDRHERQALLVVKP
jgi:nucleotide-binding universal stress UspA family protein